MQQMLPCPHIPFSPVSRNALYFFKPLAPKFCSTSPPSPHPSTLQAANVSVMVTDTIWMEGFYNRVQAFMTAPYSLAFLVLLSYLQERRPFLSALLTSRHAWTLKQLKNSGKTSTAIRKREIKMWAGSSKKLIHLAVKTVISPSLFCYCPLATE